MPKNPYPWPSINNVAASLDGRVDSFLKSCNAAATVIAHAYQHYRSNVLSRNRWMQVYRRWKGLRVSHRIVPSKEFHDFFNSTNIVATQKYDGTNVGVTEDGLVLGRRQLIDPNAEKYQGTSLAEVRAALKQAPNVKETLLGQVGELDKTGQTKLHCAIYGELMCNGSRFDYRQRKLDGAFACFGVIFRGQQSVGDSFAEDVVRNFVDAGFTVGLATESLELVGDDIDAHPSVEKVQIKLMMCPALRKVFEQHDLVCVAPATRASLVKIVENLSGWMMKGNGEGVVLTIQGSNPRCNGLAKWKTATESQGSTPDVLKRLIKHLSDLGQFERKCSARIEDKSKVGGADSNHELTETKVQVVHPEIVSLLKTMYAVSVSDCGGNSHTEVAKRKKKKKKNKGKPNEADELAPIADEELEAAYESALTKFDTLEAMFAEGQSVRKISNTLFEELAIDLDCKDLPKQPNSGSEICDLANGKVKALQRCACPQCRKQMAKQGYTKRFIMRNVGTAFGTYKVKKTGIGN